VAERDEDALSEALLEWTQRPDELSALAGSGAATVRKKFEQQAQVRQLEDYYFEAIGTTPPAAAG
jgi:glycosyltransferase involved in cell wall biosynthesis